jgi:hypothetical protein
MQLKNRTVSAVVSLAVGATLAVAPALLAPASATPAPSADARMTVTAECAAARTGLANAQSQKAAAHRAVVKAKKKLRKAKHSHRPARIKKAKRVLKKARHRYAVRSRAVNTQNKRVAYACAAPTSATRANATGQKIDLLVLATGTLTSLLDTTQLTALLDRLLPGVSGVLSPAQLTSLTSGFNTGPLTLDDATALLDGSFTPAQLTSILDGTASPALVLDLADHIISQLSGMAGGFPIPGSFDPTDLLQTIAGVFGTLDPSQLGSLLALVTLGVNGDPTGYDLTKLTTLLDALVPGVSTQLTPTQLTSMLTALNAGGLDAGTLTNLLGGQFSAAQLQQVLAGTAGSDLLGGVIANVMAQLGTVGGGNLALPGTLDPSVLTSLVSTVTTLVTDLLGGVLGGGTGGLVCTLLPILC